MKKPLPVDIWITLWVFSFGLAVALLVAGAMVWRAVG